MKKIFILFSFTACLNLQAQICMTTATNFPSNTSVISIASADFNSDGRADLAVANFASSNISILLGNGNGTFAAAVYYAAGSAPESITAADFNGDFIVDLAVANNSSANFSVFLGTGTGTFGAATNFPSGSGSPVSITHGDFNADSKLDLAIAHSSGNVGIYLGNGTGGFSATTNFLAATYPVGIATADFNGDLILDLAIANQNSNNMSVLFGVGNGNFLAATNFAAGTKPRGATCADFNADGNMDVAMVNFGSRNISVFLGSVTGSFGAATNYSTGFGPLGAISQDFNADGKMDLAVANDSSTFVSVLLGTGTGSFSPALNFTTANGGHGVASMDFDGNGRLDLAVACFTPTCVSVLLNNPDTLSGFVRDTNNVAVTSGKVYVFQRNITHAGLLDTMGYTNIVNGNYTFPCLDTGNYVIKAVADTLVYPTSVPTYYSFKTYPYQWDSAFVVGFTSFNVNLSGNNIQIIQLPITSGPGTINGQITKGVGYGQRYGGGNQVLGAPLKGVDVKLGKNPGGSPAARTTTDATGHYNFTNVPLGSYKIYVDVPNYPMDSTLGVVLTSTNTASAGNNYYIDSAFVRVDSAATGISNPTVLKNNSAVIYPNPASTNFKIEIPANTKYILQVSDINGKIILSQTINTTSIIDASGFNTGVYNVSLLNEIGVLNKRLIIVR